LILFNFVDAAILHSTKYCLLVAGTLE